MALNLADVQANIDTRRRGSVYQDFTLPGRRETDAPRAEVNAQITRPNNSAAQVLLKTLGLAEDAGQAAAGYYASKRAEKNDQRSAQAGVDFGLGHMDEAAYKKFEAYRNSWDTEKAKKSAFDLDQLVTANVTALLEDEQEPATLEDVKGTIDAAFHAALTGPDGNLIEFPTEDGKRAVAEQMAATRARLMSGALKVIKTRQDNQTREMVSSNIVDEKLRQFAPTPEAAVPTTPTASLTTPSPAPASVSSTILPGLPAQGAVGSGFGPRKAPMPGASKNHMGVDIKVPAGTPVDIRAGGKVTFVGDKGRGGGLEINIDHGNGVVTKYLHLSKADVKVGQTVDAGDAVAASGSSGRSTGPHLHYSVVVDGKHVDPLSYKWDRGASAPAEGPQPTMPGDPPAQQVLPQIDAEADLARFPDGIDRKTAKGDLINSYITAAEELKRPDLLDALWRSKKKDGSNSFSPDEINTIREARDKAARNMRVEAERLKNERYEANLDSLYEQWNNGKAPTTETIRQWGAADKLPPKTVRALIEGIEADQRQEEREARGELRQAEQDARQVEREREAEIDADAALMAEEIRMGVRGKITTASVFGMFESGALGTGKAAVRRMKALNMAIKAAAQTDPQTQAFAAKLVKLYKPPASGGSVASIRGSAGGGDEAQAAYAAMLRHYQNLAEQGTNPGAAFLDAVEKYGAKANPQAAAATAAGVRKQRIEALRTKAAQ